jgi:hypothetical protein
LIISITACNFTTSEEDKDKENLEQTEVALSVEQTLAAQEGGGAESTIAAQQATIQAQQAQPPQPQVTAPVVETAPPVVVNTEPPPVSPSTPNPAPRDFSTQMKNAQILLFEDIVADPSMSRYIKQVLDGMGLRYKDDGNAIGWLKNDLLSNSPAGTPWDLVIVAVEARGEVSGEYFEFLLDVINKGSSVILEAWHLDEISTGKVGPLLAKCGVQVYPYFPMSQDLTDVVMYPYPAAANHPIMNDPNRGMSFTKSLDTWLYFGDLGSLMAVTGQGDPAFLLGRKPKSEFQDAGLVSCMGGKLIMQTFSSHSFSYQTISPLWENYITNALRVRFGGG